MKKLIFLCLVSFTALFAVSPTAFSQTKKARPKAKPPASSPGPVAPVTAALTDDEVSFGLKDALSSGTARANDELGHQGGFYDHADRRLPMPAELESVVNKLRDQKYDDLADDFVVAMNRAAEHSVIESSFMVKDAIRQMKIDGPKGILAGEKDAATQYFRRASEKVLLAKVTETVMTANSELGVLDKYDQMLTQAGGLYAPFDVNKYVAQKMLDGIFAMMAAEEKRIREEPAARKTAAMKKIFGSAVK